MRRLDRGKPSLSRYLSLATYYKQTMPTSKSKENNEKTGNQTKIAVISAVTTLLAAVITGIFGLLQLNMAKRSEPTPLPLIEPLQVSATATVATLPVLSATSTSSPTPDSSQPTVELDGPATIPLGKKSYFTILSTNALRAEWSVGGFANNKTFVVEPLAASHQIFIEPTDATRVGDSFTLIVTVFGKDGANASVNHQVQVVAGP